MGQDKGPSGFDEYDRSAVDAVDVDMRHKAQRVADADGCSFENLEPACAKQWHRVLVPCKRSRSCQWQRMGPVTTLGELCMAHRQGVHGIRPLQFLPHLPVCRRQEE